MTDKQRLDAYVQAVMVNTLGSRFGYEQIYKFAKGMMDYVDAQEVKVTPRADATGWIVNMGYQPCALDTRIDFILRNGSEGTNEYARGWDWEIKGSSGDIIKWRKAQ